MSANDYTPDTEQVRAFYAESYRWPDGTLFKGKAEQARAEFDRWLASVKAEALREAADYVDLHPMAGSEVLELLRSRADELEGK